MPSLFRLFAALPLWLLHPLGALMGWVAFAASPTYRRRFLANARQAGYGPAGVAPGLGRPGAPPSELQSPHAVMGRRLLDIHTDSMSAQACPPPASPPSSRT